MCSMTKRRPPISLFLPDDGAQRDRRAIHPKAMPVILTTAAEVDLWLAADAPKALELQRPLPDSTLRIVASGGKEDRAPALVRCAVVSMDLL